MLSLHRLAGDILNTAEAFFKFKFKFKIKIKIKIKTCSVLSFKKVRAAFKNGAEREVENRVSLLRGLEPEVKEPQRGGILRL